ncbi:MAG: protease modulator HflC [Clostridia bacterium]|nr:protease modulator HflC [Clostridia bacterium]
MKKETMETNEIKEVKETKKRSGMWIKILIAVVLLVIVGYFGFTCEVREGSSAVILRFGAPRAEITEAGLYFKLPWPFESVVKYDTRLQYTESNSLETTTKDNRNVILRSSVLWSVSDPLKFHNSVGSMAKVESYIQDQVFSATNSVIGSYEMTNLVSLDTQTIKSDEIQSKIFDVVKQNCEKSYGIAVQDVSFLRISLPTTNLESVFAQMNADRQKDIDSILAKAERDADILQSAADVECAEIVSKAEIEAAEIYAKTEAEVAKIYAEAQSANLELYKFLKELDTIIASVGTDDIYVVTSDTYPFNVLLSYSDTLMPNSEGLIQADLSYMLSKMPEEERETVVTALCELIAEAGKVS